MRSCSSSRRLQRPDRHRYRRVEPPLGEAGDPLAAPRGWWPDRVALAVLGTRFETLCAAFAEDLATTIAERDSKGGHPAPRDSD